MKKYTRKKVKKEDLSGEQRTAHIPEKADGDEYGFMCIVSGGLKLEEFGIIDNDVLIVKRAEENDEDKITVWDTPDGRQAKFAFVNFDDVTLYNKGEWMRRYPASKMELIGTVEYIQREINLGGAE